MALGDREHVEAVAIMRNLIAAVDPLEADDEYADACVMAGQQWLSENQPAPAVYAAALVESVRGACAPVASEGPEVAAEVPDLQGVRDGSPPG